MAPTVICGRNQSIDDEFDRDYCRSRGIDMVRRRSGGGAVYADMDNVMFSYITSGGEVAGTFSRYTSLICSMLGSLGIDAEPTGRNDISVGGRKVAGNAFYRLPGRSIVHGTMLLRVDGATMARALTPSRDKLTAKGVRSVPSRVAGLTDFGLTMDAGAFADYACRYLCDEELVFSEADIAAAELLEQEYYRPEYLAGRRAPSAAAGCGRRIEGVGEIALSISVDGRGRIDGVTLGGDFFAYGDAEGALSAALRGVEWSHETLAGAAAAIDAGDIIRGLSSDVLAEMLLEACKTD